MIDKLFKEYKELTIMMIEDLKKDKNIVPPMERRGKILEEIKNLPISEDEKKYAYKSLEISKEDKLLGELIKVKMQEYKNQIQDSGTRKSAYSAYMKNNRSGNLFARKV